MNGFVLCVGEPLIALTPPAGNDLRAADQLLVAVGGAEVNVAVGLAQLGLPARFAGRIGADPFGLRILSALHTARVDIRWVDTDPERPTGLYLKDPTGSARYYRRGSAGAALGALPAEALVDVDHLHLTGITPALSTECRDLVESLFALKQFTISFDINFRPALWPAATAAPILLDLARRADIVFTGLDEAAALWQVTDAQDVRAVLPAVTELVVKDGPADATVFHDSDRVDVLPPAVDIIEPTGAGDAFAAGYLAARRRGEDLAAALRSGHLLAGIVLGHHGDHAEPPTARELHIARTGHGWPDAL
ncbi:sugar kinase [Nocardia pseudovaccinii]|uniref:sugar kinase n=1 Tax=Nocardia pseudovaccinii TaxID=189540 RepID=UPI0007A428F6|nr:sugar kinase [Nocardia pseudovaccinii]